MGLLCLPSPRQVSGNIEEGAEKIAVDGEESHEIRTSGCDMAEKTHLPFSLETEVIVDACAP